MRPDLVEEATWQRYLDLQCRPTKYSDACKNGIWHNCKILRPS